MIDARYPARTLAEVRLSLIRASSDHATGKLSQDDYAYVRAALWEAMWQLDRLMELVG